MSSADYLNQQQLELNAARQASAAPAQRVAQAAAPAATAAPAAAAAANQVRWDGARYWYGTQYWNGTGWVDAARQPAAATNGAMPPTPSAYGQPQSAYARYGATSQLAGYAGYPGARPEVVSAAPSEWTATERFRGLVREAVNFCGDRIRAIGKSTTDVENICMRMMGIESNGVVNPGGKCVGLMQLEPGTARTMMARYNLPVARNLLNPRTNIMCGVNYYVEMLETFGSYRTAAAAYNWGPHHDAIYQRDEARYPWRTQHYVAVAMG